MIVLALGCAVIALPNIVHFPHGLEITHLDVGQADAAVIRTPHDRVILIDTGGELERAGATSNAGGSAGAAADACSGTVVPAPAEEATGAGAAAAGATGKSFSVSPATFEYLCRNSAKRSALTVSFRSR